MKKEIHPDYHPVVFVDSATGDEILTKSTLTSDEKRDIDGIAHYVVYCDITSFTTSVTYFGEPGPTPTAKTLFILFCYSLF